MTHDPTLGPWPLAPGPGVKGGVRVGSGWGQGGVKGHSTVFENFRTLIPTSRRAKPTKTNASGQTSSS